MNVGRPLYFAGVLTSVLTYYLRLEMALKDLFVDQDLHYAMYHSKTPDRIKKHIQEEFKKSDGNIRVVVGTSAVGMGIDIPEIRLVVHYAPPADIESFVQGIGRAGKKSDSLIIVRPADYSVISDKLETYVRNVTECRRKVLMDAFSEKTSVVNVNCCDFL